MYYCNLSFSCKMFISNKNCCRLYICHIGKEYWCCQIFLGIPILYDAVSIAPITEVAGREAACLM